MNEKKARAIRLSFMLAFLGVVFALLIRSRILAYSLAPTMTPASFEGMSWWEIPIQYVWDYLSHAYVCLLFAFSTAGLVSELVPKHIITRYLSSKSVKGYVVASLVAPFLTVCSCTMVPLFAGIVYAGGGIGPAITFLLMAPAANIMTILLTGELLSWELAGVRVVASLISAVGTGIIVARTPWGRKMEQRFSSAMRQKAPAINEASLPVDERMWAGLKLSASLGKRILPFLIIGVATVSYLEAYLPEEMVATHLTGIGGILLASVLGGPLYTPTLVEVVLGRTLLNLGMSFPAALSWLMGQPYDIPNMLATSRIVNWKIVVTYAVLGLIFSIMSGLIYACLTGRLI